MWVAWRLLGRNNRELGRSPVTYRSIPACLSAIARLKADVDVTTRLLAVDPEDGRWLWRLESLGSPMAVSARSYQRQRECLYSLNQFVAAVSEAALPATEIEMPGPPRRPDAPPTPERASPNVATVIAPSVAPVGRGHLRVAGGMAS